MIDTEQEFDEIEEELNLKKYPTEYDQLDAIRKGIAKNNDLIVRLYNWFCCGLLCIFSLLLTITILLFYRL